MSGLDKDYRTVDDGTVIVADDASEIQAAIDEITERRHEGNHVGGIVQLKPKAYYPETTIWLKRGVILRGAREWPQHVNPTASAYGDVDSTQATTLYTSELPEGPAWEIRPEDGGAHTYRHFNESGDLGAYREHDYDKDTNEQWWHGHTHPHLPVVSAYTKQPIYYNDPLTEDHKRYWGDGVGLMNLRIHADQTRYWDPDDEPNGSQREEHATYFGVYDGFLFEDLERLHVSNVQVGGFDGYTAFYQDIQQVVSKGNFYSGTATDHHGSALALSHANTGTNRYMRGLWDLRVEGPTPTVQVDNHGDDTRFVGGGNIKNIIDGQSCRFLGSETTYDNGNAPIVNEDNKDTVVVDQDSIVHWDNYQIKASDHDDKVAYDLGDSNTHLHNVQMGDVVTSGFNITIRDSRISNVTCRNAQPYVVGCHIGNGIELRSRANDTGGWHGCYIGTNDDGYSITGSTNQEFHLHGCDVPGGLSDPGGMRGKSVLYDPTGWANAASDQAVLSADGSTASFSMAHGMDETPQHVVVTPRNAAARDNWPPSWSAANGEITLEFASEPSSDPEVSWSAIGWSHPKTNPDLVRS